MTLSGVVLDCPDPQALATFYEELLGWRRTQDEPGWVKLAGSDGGAGLSFQREDHFITPTWPAGSGEQQMQVHLDIHVDDLEVAGDHATVKSIVTSPSADPHSFEASPSDAAAISLRKAAITAGGVLAVAKIPIQESISNPGTPDSVIVGTFGMSCKRFAVRMAMPLACPDLM